LKDDFNILFYFWVYSQIWLNLPTDDDSNFWMIATLATNKNSPKKRNKTMEAIHLLGLLYYAYKNVFKKTVTIIP
jgi:hypothetical protein